MASDTYNNQGVSTNTIVQGLNSHGGHINVSVYENPGKRLALLDWLSLIYIEKHHQDLTTDLVIAENSGRWFFESDQYFDWENFTKPNLVLWCPGLPGAGKTVMASLVIDRLRTWAAVPWVLHKNSVCWLYLGHTESKGRPGALLRALLRHLVCQSENMPYCVEILHKHLEAGTSPTDLSVLDCIVEVCQGKENIFLVIDAMDEYPEAQRTLLIEYLQDMRRKLPALRILITSRWIQSIATELGSPICYNIEAHDDDLVAFVRKQLDLPKNRHLEHFSRAENGGSISLVNKIVDTVVLRSQGL